MGLTLVWERRVDRWIEAIAGRLTTPLKALDAAFAPTMEHLTVEQARTLPFKPVKPGRAWGRKWEYSWFRCTVRLPRSRPGRPVVLIADVGSEIVESIVFVDGVAAGGLDRWHTHIDLSRLAASGRTVEVLIESYAGHGPTPGSRPFVLPHDPPPAPPSKPQQVFGGISLAEWNEPAYQLWMDAKTLAGLRRCAPADGLRQIEVGQALVAATAAADPEAPDKDFDAQVPRARAALAPALAATNGSTAPRMYCFGHSHIDVAWLWPLAQTYRKNAHTFSTMLALMDRYGEFRFLQSQAQLYDHVKAQYPEIYRRMKRAVRRGQWIVEGGMWVEADTNVSGGEALIRQFLYGKRFFAREFGVDCETLWLPDVFGYSAAMPQIMAGCGIKYFSTQKIYWNLHGGTDFPYETFIWEGIDGSEVLAHHHRNYNATTDPETVAKRWDLCVSKDGTHRFLYPFGYGDGGGGPTRDHLEHLRREADLEGMPRTRIAGPAEFFADLEKQGRPADRYVGELYFELHRGTYTSQARTKLGNRRGELALRTAELWSAAAAAAGARGYPADLLAETWKKLLLNQFHDVLPGSSIARVHAEAEALHEEVLADADGVATAARQALSAGRAGWTVWNALSWPRDALVELPARKGAPVDAEGTPLPAQSVGRGRRRRLLVAVPDVPAFGGKTVRLRKGEPGSPPAAVEARASTRGAVMENDLLRLRINGRGEVAELFDKAAGRRVTAAGRPMNALRMYRDNPAAWDAWDVDETYPLTPVPLGPAESVKVAAAGPLEARVSVRRRIGRSILTQSIVLRAGSRRVDFETRVDWRETHRLLKAAFPADLQSAVLRGEIQFGHVVRPTHRNTLFERMRFEWPAQKWADLSESDYGIAVLNDCKYGYDHMEGELRLTLLRAPAAPDPQADRGVHEFTYALLCHDGPFDGRVVRAAYELNVPPAVAAGRCRAEGRGFVEVSHPAAIVETVKRSEDGRGTVVRLYESLGGSATVRLRIAAKVKSAEDCDMLERPRRTLRVARDGWVTLRLRPFQVRTIRFAQT